MLVTFRRDPAPDSQQDPQHAPSSAGHSSGARRLMIQGEPLRCATVPPARLPARPGPLTPTSAVPLTGERSRHPRSEQRAACARASHTGRTWSTADPHTQETDGCIPLTRKHTHEHSDNVIAPLARVLWVALPLSKLSTAWEEDPGPAFTSSKSAKNSTTGD